MPMARDNLTRYNLRSKETSMRLSFSSSGVAWFCNSRICVCCFRWMFFVNVDGLNTHDDFFPLEMECLCRVGGAPVALWNPWQDLQQNKIPTNKRRKDRPAPITDIFILIIMAISNRDDEENEVYYWIYERNIDRRTKGFALMVEEKICFHIQN